MSVSLCPGRYDVPGFGSTGVRLSRKRRIAFVVSHPIQYFVPLYQRLSRRDDVEVKVFFTWHGGTRPVEDPGFRRLVAWDVPIIDGYEHEIVPNTSVDPGTHSFFGLRNPQLVSRVVAWRPDVVHLSGWAWWSHVQALHAFHRLGARTLFLGDSHLLDAKCHGVRWWIKQSILRRVFSWPNGFLVVGRANRAYYERFGVERARLHPCPHSIDVGRFAEPNASLEQEAVRWRRELGISSEQTVLLYAGKFERKKRPTELMRVVAGLRAPGLVLILVGNGELQDEVDATAATDPGRFRVLPFQNQSRMPVVYRLGDIFILPSAYGESWGLAVNEALACGRPVVVSDRVGCAADLIDSGCGRVFAWNSMESLESALNELIHDAGRLMNMRRAASARARLFDVAATEAALLAAVEKACVP